MKRVLAVLAAALLCVGAAQADDRAHEAADWEGPASLDAGAPPTGKIVVYRGATLIDGTGGPARAGLSIVVDGGKIAALVPASEPAPAGAEVVDATGLFVLPGLIDSHVHLATPPDRRIAEAELRRAIYGGITAVRDMADDLRLVGELAREARVGEIPAPDIYYAALMAGPSFFDDPRTIAVSQGAVPGQTPWMQAVDASSDMPLAIAMARGTSASAVKIYANLPPDMVRKIAAEAHRQGLPVWAHGMVFPTPPAEVIDAGPDVISHTCYLAYQFSAKRPASYQDATPADPAPFAHGDNPDMAALLARMKAKGIILDATTRVYVEGEKAYAAKATTKPPRCGSDLAFRLTAQAYREGLLISAGTDGFTPWQDAYPSLHEELEYLSKKVGMPNAQVIRSATQISAMAAGREAEMGAIAPGKLANLVFVDKDPLADISNLRRVVFTVKRGVSYARKDYRPITADEVERPPATH